MEKKKIFISVLAALAGGGVLFALYKNKKDKEKEKEKESSDNTVTVTPPTQEPSEGVEDSDEEILGGGSSGGGGGGGGGGANMTLCRGLNDEGEEVAELVNIGEACPENAPFSDDVEWDEYLYDAFHCYDVDEEGEITEQDIEFDEVCGEDFPEFPFDTQNDALLYASDPETYEGCTDETAFNFNEDAILDDGSCESVVEGCMVETALNYDEDANTQNEDSCEYPPEAVLGCMDEEANNYDEAADTDDGSCLFDVTCYSITENYDVEPTTLELAQGETCYIDVEPIYSDEYFRTGFFNASEDAEQYLEGFFGEAADIMNEDEEDVVATTCFYVNIELSQVLEMELDLLEGEDCESASSLGNIPFDLFNTFEDAQATLPDISNFDTQDCWTFDVQGTHIISDVPLIDSDTQDILSCEDFGYFNTSVSGELEAQNAYDLAYPPTEGFEDVDEEEQEEEPIEGFEDVDEEEQEEEPIEGFEDVGEEEQEEEPIEGFEGTEETSAIISSACGDINICFEVGGNSAQLMTILPIFNSGEATATEINNLLGFECFDPVTCEILYEEEPEIVGQIEAAEAQNLLLSCFPSTTGVSDEAMSVFPAINAQNYPIMWSDFNTIIGFNCLNANAEVVNPFVYEEPTSGLDENIEDEIVDDSGSNPDPIVGYEDVIDPDPDPDNEPDEESTEGFSNFVNLRTDSPSSGCTDPMAHNFNEGAETDDGSCDY